MPLLDHFHAPLKGIRHWESFHSGWANSIAAALNQVLPQNYFAEPQPRFGIEIDVAAFDVSQRKDNQPILREVATLPYTTERTSIDDQGGDAHSAPWQAKPPPYSIPFEAAAESVAVLIYNDAAGPVLVGAIELISPANKDRPVQRQAFVSKSETYLRQGVGLVMIDIVTERKANLHNELMVRLAAPKATHITEQLYAVAYRAVQRHDQPQLDLWPEPLTLGRMLPTMPLWLSGEILVPVLLEATYARTCYEQRIVVNAVP